MKLVNILLACLVALLVSFALTYPVRYLASRFGFMDIPKDDRRMHTEPRPLIGGVAVYLAFIAAMCVCRLFGLLLPYVLGGLTIIAVGMLDDKYSIKPWMKLAGQAAAGIVLCIFDITVERLTFFGVSIDLGIFAYPMTVIWVIAVTNIFNLIDGLDGLCCGTSIICAAALGLISFFSGNPVTTAAALIYAAACLGFLPHNTFPARIFIGDTGAMFSGFVLAALSCTSVYSSRSVLSAIIPIVIFGIPVFDAVYALVRRLVSGQNVFLGDKMHIHHRLSRRYGHMKAVILMYGASVLLAGIAVIIQYSLAGEIAGTVLTLLAIAYGVVRFAVIKEQKKEDQ